MLVRPAASGIETFLVRRHDNVAFMGGAHVFPGGRVDPADDLDNADEICDGIESAVAQGRGLAPSTAVAFHVAAIRELFEEAGVLLARQSGGHMLAFDNGNVERFASYRDDMNAARTTLPDIARSEGLRLALDALALFAHWVTPEVETRRFDTRFFLAAAPAVQEAAHDRLETTEGEWLQPAAAIERCLDGKIALPPPTWTTLRALSRCATAQAAWDWARMQPAPRVQPCLVERSDGTRIVMLPGDPGCPAVEGFDAQERRFLLQDGRWRPVSL